MSKTKSKKRKPDKKEILEVMDKKNRPLGAFSRHDVHRLNLLHRSVLVLFYNTNKELYIQQRSRKLCSYPGYWDLSAAGHVQLGESTQEAAQRELEEELGVYIRRLHLKCQLPASEDTGYEFVYLYSAGRCAQKPSPNPAEIQNSFFVQKNELACLIDSFAQLLTPALLHFWRLGLLFPTN